MSLLPPYLSITTNHTEVVKALIKKWKIDRVAILVDENTRKLCLPKMLLDHDILLEIKSGEEHKTIATCKQIWSQLTKANFTRKSLLINLGGGVIGDMGGFVAGTYKRGMRFINIPTTLLSQVDASIGGKLGVDFGSLKNHIGIFQEPDQVIVNTAFLESLSEREVRSGFAEVIKHALISSESQWKFLKKKKPEALDWNELIPTSIALKNAVVTSDPTEQGLRKILNFGHTLGHAIESHFLHTSDRLLHGEAIAIGMILESHLSFQKGWLAEEILKEIRSYIESVFELPKTLPQLEVLQENLLQDKKNDSKGINFSLIDAIGSCKFDVQVTEDMIKSALTAYESN